jgi:pimeloyl-ACP methyl ester carboxylesterase
MEGREGFLTQHFSKPEVLQALIRLTDSSVSYNVVDRLHEITCPTLIISSSEDVLVPPTEQQLLHQKIKGSMYVTVNGSGHASMYEVPESFAALTLGFANLPISGINI